MTVRAITLPILDSVMCHDYNIKLSIKTNSGILTLIWTLTKCPRNQLSGTLLLNILTLDKRSS